MKRLLHTGSAILLVIFVLFANPGLALASEGDGGHELEVEVNGFHVTLSSQNEWVRGENMIVVSISDKLGMPVSDSDVEILIQPKTDAHAVPEADGHGAEPEHGSMPGMEPKEAPSEAANAPLHGEKQAVPLRMAESHEHGEYAVETDLESSGEHEVQVFFHVNGEMLQASFLVHVAGAGSKTIVLWSFVAVNLGLVTFAGFLKRQSVTLKGEQ